MTPATLVPSSSPLSPDSALQRAATFAALRGWPWLEPVRIIQHRPLLRGRATTSVLTHADKRGGNVLVVFDTSTGAIVSAVCCLR